MTKLTGALILFALFFSTPGAAALLKIEVSFTNNYLSYRIHEMRTEQQLNPILFTMEKFSVLQTNSVTTYPVYNGELFDKAAVNASAYLFGLAAVSSRRSYFRIHNGKGPFPYKALSKAANLLLLHKLQGYHYALSPNKIPKLAKLGLRVEWSEPTFRL